MELKIKHVGSVSNDRYCERADIVIPLSTRGGNANLEIRAQEEVVDAGTSDANFQFRITVSRWLNDGTHGSQETLLERTFRTDEIDPKVPR